MVGEEILIGAFSSVALFASAAKAKLANALNWDVVEDGVQIPGHNLKVVVKNQESDFIFGVSNGQITNTESVRNRFTSSYIWYWNIIKTADGAVAIGYNIYYFAGNSVSVEEMTTFPIVFSTNSNGILGSISNNYNSTINNGSTKLFYDDSATYYAYEPTSNYNSVFKFTCLTKLPDPFRGGTFNGLYLPLFTSTQEYNGVYEVGGKRFYNVTRSKYSIAIALN